MPPFIPYNRPPLSAPLFAAVAQPVPRSSPSLSSYTSLDHALGQEGARESTSLYQPPSHPGQPSQSQMASDSRYTYHASQEVAPPYGYTYAASPYEPPQFAQNVPRPAARSGSSQAHSPHQPPQPYTQPPPPYPAQSPYGPPAYGMAQSAGPWAGEGWTTHYPPTYPPPQPPPGQEPPHSYNGARPDVPASESRGHQPGPATRPESQRADERPNRPVEAAPQSKVRKTRENDAPAPAPPRSPPSGLDFVKLSDQYGTIMETQPVASSQDNSASRATVSPETLERMLQAAVFGVQALESVSKRTATAEVPQRSPAERTSEEALADLPAKPRSATESLLPPEAQTCLGCNATSTPEWRRGPMGPRTLCNACGLVYAKLIKKRNRDSGRSRNTYLPTKQGGQGDHGHIDDSAAASSGEGGSDDDDSYGSQNGRSDGGFHGGRE